MQFNMYSSYSYAAGEFKTACDDKILVDLQQLRNLTEFKDVSEFVNRVFGEGDGEQWYDYPNNIEVQVVREENHICVGALKDEKQFFGKQWRLVTD